MPSEEVPPELPEPTLGINFARDDVSRRDWISLVAMHSDSWLLSVADPTLRFFTTFILHWSINNRLKKNTVGIS